MNTVTPFSGLSVIIHILIIGIAVIAKKIIKKTSMVFRTPKKMKRIWSRYSFVILPIISICIVIIVTLWVSVSTTIAVRTGLREGAEESHFEFLQKKYAYLEETLENINEWNKSFAILQNDRFKNYSSINPKDLIYKTTYIEDFEPTLTQIPINQLLIKDNPFNFR